MYLTRSRLEEVVITKGDRNVGIHVKHGLKPEQSPVLPRHWSQQRLIRIRFVFRPDAASSSEVSGAGRPRLPDVLDGGVLGEATEETGSCVGVDCECDAGSAEGIASGAVEGAAGPGNAGANCCCVTSDMALQHEALDVRYQQQHVPVGSGG